MALANDGTVWAWGGNGNGQIGDGNVTSVPVLVPFHVPGLSGVTAVSAGVGHSLALLNDGTVWAWGSNSLLELGSVPASSAVPSLQPVPNLTGITAIVAGNHFSMALKNDGTVWTWGQNQSGQIGNGTSGAPLATPYQVDNLNHVTNIDSGGSHCLARRDDGSVWAWGDGSHGQLGIGSSPATQTRPAQVVNLIGVTAIAAGGLHSLALKNDGTVWSWGDNFNFGVLGNGNATGISNVPVQVSGLSGIAAIAGGIYSSIALGNDGSTWVWGNNTNGELGIGGGQLEVLPVEVNNITEVTAVAAGGQHSAALRSDGTVWSWGANNWGQFGNSTTSATVSSTPTQAAVLTGGVSALSAGGNHGLAIRANGSVWAWGLNQYGQIGNGSAGAIGVSTPVKVNVLSGVFTAVSAGFSHSLALKSDGTVWAWGYNAYGQVGNGGSASPVTNPVQVTGLTGVTAISAGGVHSMALRNDGSIWVWGSNLAGQIGNGSAGPTPATSPFQVPGLSTMSAIAAGNAHCLAVQNDGTVWAWGDNNSGELGNGGTSASLPSPFQIPGLTGVTAVTGGNYFSEALKNDGTVWSWGLNSYGQLGDGTTTQRTSPVQVTGLTGVTSISSGLVHNLARLPTGLVWGWGANGDMTLGQPVVMFSVVPVEITH